MTANLLPSRWTEDNTARLQALAAQKLTAAQIGERLGFTRNAIIGRLRRLNVDISPWNDEKEAKLRELVASGLTASRIGEQLQTTRMAVLAKCQRMGLRLLNPRGGRQTMSKPHHIVHRLLTHTHVEQRLQSGIVPLKIGLLSLEDHHCRYPLDEKGEDGLELFCGHPVEEKVSYCAGHCRVVFHAALTGG